MTLFKRVWHVISFESTMSHALCSWPQSKRHECCCYQWTTTFPDMRCACGFEKLLSQCWGAGDTGVSFKVFEHQKPSLTLLPSNFPQTTMQHYATSPIRQPPHGIDNDQAEEEFVCDSLVPLPEPVAKVCEARYAWVQWATSKDRKGRRHEIHACIQQVRSELDKYIRILDEEDGPWLRMAFQQRGRRAEKNFRGECGDCTTHFCPLISGQAVHCLLAERKK